MNAQAYYQQLIALIGSVSSIVSSNVTFREIDETECYIKAMLTFATGHELHLAEYVTLDGMRIRRLKYRYQLLTADKQMLPRWDNAPHHKNISSFPYHRHDARERAHPSVEMSPADVIAETLALIE